MGWPTVDVSNTFLTTTSTLTSSPFRLLLKLENVVAVVPKRLLLVGLKLVREYMQDIRVDGYLQDGSDDDALWFRM